LCFVSILVALLAVVTTAATAQERFGGIAGVVSDSESGSRSRATITATNKQTGAQSCRHRYDGAYHCGSDPGDTVTVELRLQKVRQTMCSCCSARPLISATLKVGGVISRDRYSDTKTQVDCTARPSLNVTAEELDRMPKTRSFRARAHHPA
jgi:hypothetical protein